MNKFVLYFSGIAIICLCYSCLDRTIYIDDLGDLCRKELNLNNTKGYVLDVDCLVGKKIRNLSGEFLDGSTYDINSTTNRIKVVNLWFGQCAPCVAEIPGLNRLVEEFGHSVDFVSLCKNDIYDDMDIVQEYKFKFRHLKDSPYIIEKNFAMNGYPTTYVVDGENIIKLAKSGGKTDGTAPAHIYELVSKEIKSILEE